MCDCQVMYNYGSPRVGNYPFALMYDVQVPHSFRVVFDGDPITAVPKFVRLYKHVGQEVRACVVGRPTCSSSHSRLTCADHQVELDKLGNIIVDPSLLEKHFRTPTKLRFGAHSMYAYRDGLRAARRGQGLPVPASYSLYRPSV